MLVQTKGKIFSEDKAIAIDYFKNQIARELKDLKSERHVLIHQACELWIAISQYEDILRMGGFKWDNLERFYNRLLTSHEGGCNLNYEVVHLEDKDREKLLVKNIKRLVYIYGIRIPLLNHRSMELELLAEMDYYAYNKIRERINAFFTECVLRGDIMNMSTAIGKHVIRYFEYPETRKVLNKGMTFKYIKELKARGETLYSAKNPSGTQYRIYFDSDGFYMWQWLRGYKVLNQNLYSFRPHDTRLPQDEIKERVGDINNSDEVLKSNLSTYRKMTVLAHHTEMSKRYQWNGTLFNRQRSKEYGITGDRSERFASHSEFDYSHLIDEDNPYGI